MSKSFSQRDFETTNTGEAAYLIFKGFDYKLDARNPRMVKIIFPAEAPAQLLLIQELMMEWSTGCKYKNFLANYQQVISEIKNSQFYKNEKSNHIGSDKK